MTPSIHVVVLGERGEGYTIHGAFWELGDAVALAEELGQGPGFMSCDFVEIIDLEIK